MKKTITLDQTSIENITLLLGYAVGSMSKEEGSLQQSRWAMEAISAWLAEVGTKHKKEGK